MREQEMPLHQPEKNCLPTKEGQRQPSLKFSLKFIFFFFKTWLEEGFKISAGKTILSAFAKLRKATIGIVISVCPSAWKNSALTGRI
jgi:hypothetical protein